jgi:hypothetical protein
MGRRKHGKTKGAAASATEVTLAASEPDAFLLGRSTLAPLLAFVALLALYVATLAPSVMGGDSGELTTAALTGGVPHPPGYPLFCLLARLFNALPLGHSPAWRVNLLSATTTAGAAALLCATVQMWTRAAAAGLLAAAVFGTNEIVWRHATSAEVFGLNACFVALAFLLWLAIERAADRRTARRLVFALLFACGLAMTNHHTFVFVGAPLALRSLWVARHHLGARGVVLALVIGLVGLLPYGYLCFASRSRAAVSWGDLSTLDGFLAHVLRRNYGTFKMGQASKGSAFVAEGTFLPTLWQLLGHSLPRFAWLGGLLAFVGCYAAARSRRERSLGYVLLAVLGGYVLVFCSLSNLSMERGLYVTVLSRFCIQSDLMLAMAAGLGFAWLAHRLRARYPSVDRRARFAPAAAAVCFAAGLLTHWGECNQRKNRVFSDFVTTALASVPPRAIVITMGDHLTGSVFYFHEVEKLRADVIHLDRELLGFRWYGERKRRLHPEFYLPEGVYGRRGWNIKKLLDGNPDRRLVVIDRIDPWDESWKDGYKLATNGLVHPIVPVAEFPDYNTWLARDRKAMGDYDVFPALSARDGSWEKMLGQLVMTTQSGRAHLALVYSTDHGNLLPPARFAVTLLEDIIAKAGGDEAVGVRAFRSMRRLDTASGLWKDLGIGYEILSHYDPSYTPRVAIAYAKFLERADPDDKDIPAARGYVQSHSPAAGAKPPPPHK